MIILLLFTGSSDAERSFSLMTAVFGKYRTSLSGKLNNFYFFVIRLILSM